MVRRNKVPIEPYVPAGCVSITEYRPGRNFIRVGDVVKIVLLNGRKEEAIVKRIIADETTGEVREIETVTIERRQWRTVRPDRIIRLAQTRQEVK